MTPDHEHRAVDSALNGDEPSQASDAPQKPEPNGQEDMTSATDPEAPEAQDPEAGEAREPEAPDADQPEAPEAQEPKAPDAQAETATAPQAEQSAPATAEPEQLAEPAPDEAAVTPEPDAVEVVPEPLLKDAPAAAESGPESSQEPATAEPEPSGIAADIERALQAAAAPEPEPVAEPEPAAVATEPPAEPAAVAEAPAAEAAEAEPEADGEVAEEDEVVLRAFQPGDWFVVHTYAGYENKVKTNLESRISSMNVEEKIFEVVIPMEDVMEIKSGKKQVVQRKVFPGYLLVRMDLDDDSWYVVRNTPGVTGFVGSGARPIPLSEREVDRILQRKPVGERPKPKLEWSINDPVRVTTGPFANFQGLISEIDTDRSKLKVLVNIFGRETPVELGFDQVAKV